MIGFGSLTRRFWFVTPPKIGPDVPYTFGVIGTFWLNHKFGLGFGS